jgi:hypothetical protein
MSLRPELAGRSVVRGRGFLLAEGGEIYSRPSARKEAPSRAERGQSEEEEAWGEGPW